MSDEEQILKYKAEVDSLNTLIHDSIMTWAMSRRRMPVRFKILIISRALMQNMVTLVNFTDNLNKELQDE